MGIPPDVHIRPDLTVERAGYLPMWLGARAINIFPDVTDIFWTAASSIITGAANIFTKSLILSCTSWKAGKLPTRNLTNAVSTMF